MEGPPNAAPRNGGFAPTLVPPITPWAGSGRPRSSLSPQLHRLSLPSSWGTSLPGPRGGRSTVLSLPQPPAPGTESEKGRGRRKTLKGNRLRSVFGFPALTDTQGPSRKVPGLGPSHPPRTASGFSRVVRSTGASVLEERPWSREDRPRPGQRGVRRNPTVLWDPSRIHWDRRQ